MTEIKINDSQTVAEVIEMAKTFGLSEIALTGSGKHTLTANGKLRRIFGRAASKPSEPLRLDATVGEIRAALHTAYLPLYKDRDKRQSVMYNRHGAGLARFVADAAAIVNGGKAVTQ